MWNLIEYDDQATLAMLAEGSALTWEGMSVNSGNLDAIVQALQAGNLLTNPTQPVDFYVIKGADMNRIDGLTGDNAYPNDLNILSISLDQLTDGVVMWRFQVDARWMDDIRDNNARREF